MKISPKDFGPTSRRAILVALLVSGAAFAGCAAPVTQPSPADGRVSAWQGRFSITLTDPANEQNNSLDPQEERAQGRFELIRDDQLLDLKLFSPFGQTLASAKSSPAGAMLTTSDGKVFRASNPDALIEQALGWKIPVSALAGWLDGSGLSDPEASLAADDWFVRAEKRFASGQPRQLSARWPATQRFNERRIKLFLVVDRAS